MKQKLSCILLIDDDEANNFLSNLIIEEVGCAAAVKTQETAKAALNYLADSNQFSNQHNITAKPELIFLDINMPAMDGWEFLGKYRELINSIPQKSAPVIIMMSTSGDPKDRSKACQIPEVSEFYNKPLTPEMLHSIMLRYFSHKL